MIDELQPCPFCGSRNVARILVKLGYFRVHCYTCQADGPKGIVMDSTSPGFREAAEAWNMRATEKKQDGRTDNQRT